VGRFSKFLELAYNSKLNPKIWQDSHTLLPGIKDHLEAVAIAWREYAKVPEDAYLDTLLTGGNANFTTTAQSDLDLHVLVDPKKMPIQDEDLQHDFIMSKKSAWMNAHDIKIKGYPVEVYVQLANETIPEGQGVYSLDAEMWIREPKNLHLNFDKNKELIQLVKDHMFAIDNIATLEQAKTLKDEIVKGRGEQLKIGGEFAIGNLLFKSLRNKGYLQKLTDFIQNATNREYTFESRLQEIYDEPEDSNFTHEGYNYDLNGLLSATLGMPIIQFSVSKLIWIFKWDPMTKKDNPRIKAADESAPILITKDKDQWVVLDGIHRLAAAVKDGMKELPAIVVDSTLLGKYRIPFEVRS